MGIISSLLRKSEIKAADSQAIVSAYLTAPFSPGMAPEKNYRDLVEAYKGWVYTCIDKIAKAVAMIPLKLFVVRDKRGKKLIDIKGLMSDFRNLDNSDERKYFFKNLNLEREEIFEHPFIDLIHKPNHLMTRFMLWYESIIRMELGGSCGWYLVNDRLGIPRQIWPLPLTKNAMLRPKVSPTLDIEYWVYRDANVDRRFKSEEILLLKYPHPANPFQGMSPLMAQTYPYDIDLFLSQQQRSLFANMAVPGLHLSTEQKLTPKQVQELTDQIAEQYGGALRTGKTMVTHSGLKADKMAMTARDAMIADVARYAREKLITSYDLSEGAVGLSERINRANMEALHDSFILECLKPKCMLIEEAIEIFLLPIYDDGLTCDFELPDVKDKDLELREREQNLTTGLHTINRELSLMGEEPVPWGDRPWMPFSMIQVGSVPPPPQPSKVWRGIKGRILNWTREYWTEERKVASWNQFARRSEAHETLITDPLRRHFHHLREEVTSRLLKSGKAIEGQYAGWSRSKVQAHVRQNKSVESINIDRKAETEYLRDSFTPIVKYIIRDVGEHQIRMLHAAKGNGGRDIKATFAFNENDPKVLEWLGERMEQFSSEVSGTTFDVIRAILSEGFSEGLPLSAIADNLREKFDTWDQYRAPLISRTEVISASNRADLLALDQAGVADELLKHWLSARDNACRETHSEADARYSNEGIPIDEDFEVGADTMPHPGGGSLPEENIACRCSMFYTERGE